MATVQIRIRDDFLDKIENTKWEIKYELRTEIQNTDIVNTLIYKYLEQITAKDVLEFRREILGKED